MADNLLAQRANFTCDVVGVGRELAQVDSVVLHSFGSVHLVEGEVVILELSGARHSGKAFWICEKRLLLVRSDACAEVKLQSGLSGHSVASRSAVCCRGRNVEEICRRRALGQACRNCT